MTPTKIIEFSKPGASHPVSPATIGALRAPVFSRLRRKNPAAGKTVIYAQTVLKLHCQQKKLILTTKPALVNRIIVVDIDWRFNMLGCS
jgi:hypothetical protein